MSRDFDGSTGYLETAFGRTINTAWTVSAWINPDSVTGIQSIVGRDDSGTPTRHWQFRLNGSTLNAIAFRKNGATYTAYTASGGTVSTGSWQHVAGTMAGSGGNVTAYLNGSAGTPVTTVSPASNDSVKITVGARYLSSGTLDFFNGKIAHVAIWTVALNADEISALAKGVSPLLIRPGSLYEYYPMSGASTTSEEDIGPLRDSIAKTGTVGSASSPYVSIGSPIFIRGQATAGTTIDRQPGVGTLALTGNAPAVTFNFRRSPGVGSLALTGKTPAASFDFRRSPGADALAISGKAPTVSVSGAAEIVRSPGAGALALTGNAPTVTFNFRRSPGVGTLALTGLAPTVSTGGVVNRAPGVGSLALTGKTPTVSLTFGFSPGKGTLALTGYVPTVAGGTGLAIAIDGGAGSGGARQKRKTAPRPVLDKDAPRDVVETLYGRATSDAELPADVRGEVRDTEGERLSQLEAIRDAIKADQTKVSALSGQLDQIESEIGAIMQRRDDDALLLLLLAME